MSGQSWPSAQVEAVACALEPTLVLLNHSCDPNMIRVNSGNTTLALAGRNISAGEEITDCYTHPYHITDISERSRYLEEKYKFRCSCEACQNKWPTASFLPQSFNDISPGHLATNTSLETLQQRMKSVMAMGAKINQLQRTQDFAGLVDLYKNFDLSLKDTILKPHLFYVMASRSLGTCLWYLYGNKEEVKA